jgi:hypothetical protein
LQSEVNLEFKLPRSALPVYAGALCPPVMSCAHAGRSRVPVCGKFAPEEAAYPDILNSPRGTP